MTQRHLLAQGQRRVLGIQSQAAVYRGEVPAEPGTAIEPSAPLEPTPPAQQFVGTLSVTEVEELKPWLLAVTLGSTGNTDLIGGYLAADVIKIHDDDDSHELSFVWNESEAAANRALNLVMGGADRTVTFSGNPTLADWFDQAVKKASAPTFDAVNLYDTDSSHVLMVHWNEDDSAARVLNLLVSGGDRTITLSGNPTLADWFDQAVKVASNVTHNRLALTGGFKANLVTKTGNYTTTADDFTINCDASGGSFTITLIDIASYPRGIYNIKKIDSSANTVTIDGNGSETIDDALTAVLTAQYESITVQNDTTEWWIY